MTAQLTYGLKDNLLIHVDNVENGLACGCICANCKSPLIARNRGKKDRAHHFAHHNSDECVGALETALHLLAKQVFFYEKRITIPSFSHRSQKFSRTVKILKSKEVIFEKVELEKRLDCLHEYIVADAIGVIEGKPIFIIEFANTHLVDDRKNQKIKNGQYICLEVNLFGTELSEKAIRELLDSPRDMEWINYPELMETAESRANKKIEEILREEKQDEQKLIQLEIERKERNQQLLKTYSMDFEVELFPPKKLPIFCPIVQHSMRSFIDTNFYDHPFLKRIIDGEYWNGQIYGKTYDYHSYGKYIFLKKERVYIYPDESEYDNSEQRQYDFFYRGVNEIIRVREKANCYDCQYCLDRIQTDDFENIVVCSYGKRK